MFLWKLPRGYAKIESENNRPERLINAALSRGISLHNVERLDKTSFRAIVRISRLDAFSELAAEYGADIRVVKRGGAPVFLRSMLARPALLVSVLAAMAAIVFLSTRVLYIDVSGWDSLAELEIRRFLTENGVREFMPLSRISKRELADRISAYDERIGFVSVDTEGTVLKVEIDQGPLKRTETGGAPSSIFADKDCVIVKVFALDGKALVKPGDAVKKGDMLISGDVTPENSAQRVLTPSNAEILAQVAYRFSVTVEPKELAPVPSGKTAPVTRIDLFSLFFDSKTAFSDEKKAFEQNSALSFSPLPVFVRSGRAEELVLREREREKNDMIDEALFRGERITANSIPQGARIISKNTELIWKEDGSLEAVFSLQTIESIGYTEYI